MAERFRERGVLITGGASGIGRAIAQEFLSEGASVVVVDIDGGRASQAAAELASVGNVTALKCDVTNPAEVAEVVQQSDEKLGGIDVLVNAAGVVTMASLVDMSEREWDFVMGVNAKGPFLTMRAAIPHMLRNGGGNVVNIASQAGKRGGKMFAHYCASKAAVILLSRSVALEVAPTVRVNCICPGIVNTDMMEREYAWEEEMTGTPKATIQQRWMAGIPMGRFQEPVNIARVVLFMASDDASEMTGQAVNVTGGMVME